MPLTRPVLKLLDREACELLAHCLNDGVWGQSLAERLRPEPEDDFMLKADIQPSTALDFQTLVRRRQAVKPEGRA